MRAAPSTPRKSDCSSHEHDRQSVDSGQVWLPLDRLRQMARMEGEAWIVLAADTPSPGTIAGWELKDTDFLLSDRDPWSNEEAGGSIAY